MKIVQSYWSSGSGLNMQSGWLSPEYHWMSWALSVCQLRKFYDEVELVTDAVGKRILIDTLQLPYTSVRVVLDDALAGYSHNLWALAKIYAYSIQDEPFLHVDGDVYIWQRFSLQIENAELVAQNFEVDFPFYQAPLRAVQAHFGQIPSAMLRELEAQKQIFSCNTGVIGGHLLTLFKTYKDQAFDFIDNNVHHLVQVDIEHFNICFEQFLYYCLAKEQGINLSYIIDNQGQFDPSYPGFANFHTVPYHTWYIHAMAEYKRQESVVRHLAKRLRLNYPKLYYHILRVCQQTGISLHNSTYQAPELSPIQNKDAYFLNLPLNYQLISPPNQIYYYGKSMAMYRSVECLFSLPIEVILEQKIRIDLDVEIFEETEPLLKQTLKILNLISLQHEEIVLDKLDMILYDTFFQEKNINNAIDEISKYFPKSEFENGYLKFQNLILDRIKEGLYLGVLEWRQ